MNSRPFEILVVEDNVPDIALMKVLFANCDVPVQLNFVHDGAEGSDYLFRRGNFKNRNELDLVMVDLNMPKKDGRELLTEIKQDPQLRPLPVIVLSTSGSEREIADCYRLGASAFLSKPADLDSFQKSIRSLVDFWFGQCLLSTRPARRYFA